MKEVKIKIKCYFKNNEVNIKFNNPQVEYGVYIHTAYGAVVLAPNGYYLVISKELKESWFPLGKTPLRKSGDEYIKEIFEFLPNVDLKEYKNGTKVCTFEVVGVIRDSLL